MVRRSRSSSRSRTWRPRTVSLKNGRRVVYNRAPECRRLHIPPRRKGTEMKTGDLTHDRNRDHLDELNRLNELAGDPNRFDPEAVESLMRTLSSLPSHELMYLARAFGISINGGAEDLVAAIEAKIVRRANMAEQLNATRFSHGRY